MRVKDPDTGKKVTLYPTDAYRSDMDAFYERKCKHTGTVEIRLFTARNGAKHYRQQCLSCGDSVGQNIPKSRVPDVEVPAFDDELFSAYLEARDNEREEILRKHLKLQQREDQRFTEDYRTYMQSPAWQKKRDKVLKRANGICEGCGEARADDVHHLTYEHFMDEFLFELVAICRDCHIRIHQDEEGGEEVDETGLSLEEMEDFE